MGFHPWWTEELLNREQINTLQQKYVQDPFCLGIGECGLDKLKGIDLERQEEIFIQQIMVANLLGAPVIVHCVRAYDRVIRLKKSLAMTPWVIHGFVRNKVLAKQLLDADILMSLAPSSIMANSFEETLKYIPLNSLFLETDSDFRHNIMERYEIMATIRKIEIHHLKEQIFINFKIFFSEKWKYQTG